MMQGVVSKSSWLIRAWLSQTLG